MLTEQDLTETPGRDSPRRRWRTLVPVAILVINVGVLAYIVFQLERGTETAGDVVIEVNDEGPADAAPDDAAGTGDGANAGVSGATDEDLSAAADALVFDPSYVAGIATAVSQQMFPDGNADNIVLARDQPGGDALAAGSLVGLFDTTMLLTDSDELTPITASELDRLGDPRIHILGGPDAVSFDIEQELADAGHDVHRHQGPYQASTAVDIAASHFPEARTAVLMRAPSRTSGPVATVGEALVGTTLAASQDLPVLLSDGETLTDATEQYLEGSLIQQVLVVGNEQELSATVTDRLREIGVESIRWAGEDRFETAVTVAKSRGFESLDTAEVVVLVEGGHDSVWPAGFLGAVEASHQNGPVLLTSGSELPAATAEYLSTASPGSVEVVCTPGVTRQACATALNIAGD